MRCNTCGTTYEGTRCPACGTPASGGQTLGNFCGSCGSPAHGRFCAYCGAAIPVLEVPTAPAYRPRDDVTKVASLAWTVVLVLFIGVVVASAVFLLWSSARIFAGILSGACSTCVVYGILITPAPVLVFTLDGLAMAAWYAGVVFALVLAFTFGTLRWGRDLGRLITHGFSTLKANFWTENPWAMAAQLFAAAWCFNLIYLTILWAAGVQPAKPVGLDPGEGGWYFMFQLINAAVYEELIARVLLLGVPLLVASAVLSAVRGTPPLPARKALLGGGIAIGGKETVLIAFSATMFGAAHIFGADLYRFPPTFLGGLILGYLFLRGGLVFSILFHFIWNSFIGVLALAATDLSSATAVLAGLVALLLAAAGLPAFLLYGRWLVKAFSRPGEPPPAAPPPSAPIAPSSPFWFTCQSCGWPEAVYEAGTLRCSRCGHVGGPPPPGYG